MAGSEKFVAFIQLTLLLQVSINTTSHVFPACRFDGDTRRRTTSSRPEISNTLRSMRCQHCIDYTCSDCVSMINSQSEKDSEDQNFPETLHKHLMCRQKGLRRIRSPKFSRSIETVYLDFFDSLPCAFCPTILQGFRMEERPTFNQTPS